MSRTLPMLIAVCVAAALAACGNAAEPSIGDPAAAGTPSAPDVTTPADTGAPEVSAPLALDGVVYGEGVSLAESVPVSAILDDVDAYVGQRVRVEGIVTNVCEMRGCWFEIAGDREFDTLRFKVEDGVIEFPVTIRGKYAVAEGIVVKSGPEEETRHATQRAIEHGGDAAGEGSEEMPAIRLDGIGAVIRERQ